MSLFEGDIKVSNFINCITLNFIALVLAHSVYIILNSKRAIVVAILVMILISIVNLKLNIYISLIINQDYMKRKKSTKKIYYEIAWETRIMFIPVFYLLLILITDWSWPYMQRQKSTKNIIQFLGIQELCLSPWFDRFQYLERKKSLCIWWGETMSSDDSIYIWNLGVKLV